MTEQTEPGAARAFGRTLGPWALPVATVALAIGAGGFYGLSVGFLTFGGGVLVSAIFLFWFSLQSLAGQSPLTLDEAVSLGAPTADEEQKRAVLRALKDLEYEREVGKINDADYEVLAQRYRAEAKRLLRAVDEGLREHREHAEALLQERLSKAEPAAEQPGASAPESEPQPEPQRESEAPARLQTTQTVEEKPVS